MSTPDEQSFIVSACDLGAPVIYFMVTNVKWVTDRTLFDQAIVRMPAHLFKVDEDDPYEPDESDWFDAINETLADAVEYAQTVTGHDLNYKDFHACRLDATNVYVMERYWIGDVFIMKSSPDETKH